jgi:ATP-dependent 26S proteasome regulatory subunit
MPLERMDLAHLKTQITTYFMVRPDPNNGIWTLLYTLLALSLLETTFKHLPSVLSAIKTHVWDLLNRNTRHIPLLSEVAPEEFSSITLRRVYSKSDDSLHVEKVDGVLDYLCNLDAAKHIKLDHRYFLNTRDEIAVTSQIKAKVQTMTLNEKGEVSEVVLTLTSKTLSINDLRKWIDDVHRDFCFEKDNKLGKKKYFFNEIPVEPMKDLPPERRTEVKKDEARYRWETAPKTLTFTVNEFNTSKSFTNVFGSHVAELKERLNLFVHHPEWYQERGIPHSLGILLHGIPGAGKTSTIKAIAKDTNRHIFNLSLRPYTTQKQLTNLFYNENVVVANGDGTSQVYRIPISQRVFVIEDIDCLTNVVFQRQPGSASELHNTGDGITLSFLLNLLDGVLETPGRILVITSNYPEKLDTALVRPGRIDVRIEFAHATRELIRDMINNFYSVSWKERDIPSCLDRALTPADVLESLCNHFKDPHKAVRQLVLKSCQTKTPREPDLHVSPSSVSVGGYSVEFDQAKETAKHLQGLSCEVEEWASNRFERGNFGPLVGEPEEGVLQMDAFFQPLLGQPK